MIWVLLCILLLIPSDGISGQGIGPGPGFRTYISSLISAYSSLEITNIKPAGTGSPAIPSTNRIFRAYPGVEYNIRPAVIGGMYPYVYSLSGQPTGMTINAKTGEISWPDPQSDSGTITLSVTDAENTTVTATWAITVSTTGFLFVDASYSGETETGSISQPFKTLASMRTNTTTSNHTNILYIRDGNYVLVADYTDGTSGFQKMSLAVGPFTWLGYPGETVNISGQDTVAANFGDIYLDSLNFSDFNFNAIQYHGALDYQTIRRCTFTALTNTNTANYNQGFIYSYGSNGSTRGSYQVIQDNELSDFTGGEGIGSLYLSNKMLIENNYIHDGGYAGGTSFTTGIGPKSAHENMTIRGNRVIMPEGTPLDIYNKTNYDYGYPINNMEVCFNLLVSTATRGLAVKTWYSRYTYFYRNTIVGDIQTTLITDATTCTFDGVNGYTASPFYYYDNVIVNPNSSYSGYWNTFDYFSFAYNATSAYKNCITETGNVSSVPASNAVDTSGLLQGPYTIYIGTDGWQFSDGSTPMASY